MIRPELNDLEVKLIFEALHSLKVRKEEAFACASASGFSFVSKDFGIPQISALIDKLNDSLEVE